jgi:hypothetical protein
MSPRIKASIMPKPATTNNNNNNNNTANMSTSTHAQQLKGALIDINPMRSARLMAVLSTQPTFRSAVPSPYQSPTLSRQSSATAVADDATNHDDDRIEKKESVADFVKKRVESTKN